MTTGPTPHLYLRRCNNKPAAGIVVTRETVASVLALASVSIVDVRGDLDTGLSVRLTAGQPWDVEPGGTVERTFTYTPVYSDTATPPRMPA